MTKTDSYRPWLYRAAMLTAVTALLPITIGAIVTTVDAGMAFLDWPTSDGHNMFWYPWLKSAGDKFLEHGHRLAGALIGVVSIGLVALFWRHEPRRWVRYLALAVLLCVIAQGLLGGSRVQLDERVLAMVHGNFAAWVFALMAVVALVTSRSWFQATDIPAGADVSAQKPWAIAGVLVIFCQYVLGGLLRHLGTALHGHLALAAVVLLFVIFMAVGAQRTGIGWLRRPAWVLVGLVLFQVVLGAAAWVTRFGFPPTGYVAIQHSMPQVVARTAHAVTGMLIFMTAINYAIRVYRLDALRAKEPSVPLSLRVPAQGGVA